MAAAKLLLLLGTALLSPAAATPVWCFSRLEEEEGGGGACSSPLGSEQVPLADCCLNHAYGYRLRPHGHCLSCRAGSWGPWSPWGRCSVSCGEGSQRRGRSRGPGGDSSDGAQGQAESREWQLRACDLRCCPAAGGWSPWAPWGPCSASCGEGTQRRGRSCTQPPPSCGGACEGSAQESRSCREGPPRCPVGGSWGPWGPWGSCSGSCRGGAGPGPSRHRSRSCDSPPPTRDPPGAACAGSGSESETCAALPPCPVDGAWGAWSATTPCSVTCGLGVVRERRACDAPPPQHGGRACPGAAHRHVTCGPHGPCPVLPAWGPWGPWSGCRRLAQAVQPCSRSAGLQKRSRRCLGLGRAGDGSACPTAPGDGILEQRPCYNVQGCLLPGTWGSWSPWSLCTPPCGDSPTRNRSRHCEPTYPDYPRTLEAVEPSSRHNITFWGVPRPRCQPLQDGRGLEETRPCLHVPPCPAPDED